MAAGQQLLMLPGSSTGTKVNMPCRKFLPLFRKLSFPSVCFSENYQANIKNSKTPPYHLASLVHLHQAVRLYMVHKHSITVSFRVRFQVHVITYLL